MTVHTSPPMRAVRLNPLELQIDRRADGTILINSPVPMPAYDDRVSAWLERWAREAPDRLYLAERDAHGAWRGVTYAEAYAKVRGIAQALLARGLSQERPVMILSGNSIDHALLGLGAIQAGIPYSPISTAYSLVSTDFEKLKHIFALLTPGLVFAEDGQAYGRALEAVVPADVEIVVSQRPPATRAATAFSDLTATQATAALEVAQAAIRPDSIAKFLFTSGSTGLPKGVVNTHRMMCSNQAIIAYFMHFITEEPPVIVDWLPWNHTFGGNHNFGIILRNGGTLYIDDGKPTPAGIAATVRNLQDVSPTIYYNVPKGFESLIPYFRADKGLAQKYLSRLRLNCFAGAGLPPHVSEALDEIALSTCGERIFMLSGYGSTETSPSALFSTPETMRPNTVGLPMPGIELKLVPNGEKLEVRIKGPNITPGYWRAEKQTHDAFDEDGYYCFGDALKFADENDPKQGFVFDGRVTEDFKLATGTWVSVGPLRARFVEAFAPLVKDVAVAGHNQDDVAVLVFPDVEACRALAPGLAPGAMHGDVFGHPAVADEFRKRLTAFAGKSTGSSNRVARAILVDEPPSIDANEITDKGSMNQRAVLKHRAALVAELYAGASSERVIKAGT